MAGSNLNGCPSISFSVLANGQRRTRETGRVLFSTLVSEHALQDMTADCQDGQVFELAWRAVNEEEAGPLLEGKQWTAPRPAPGQRNRSRLRERWPPVPRIYIELLKK